MEFFADWHTHTVYSDGHGTPEENVRAAVARNLDEVAITDHGPRGVFIGVSGSEIFDEITREAERLSQLYPIKVLAGAEANVINLDGALDLPAGVMKGLDILIAGLHDQAMAVTLRDNLGWVLPNLGGRWCRRLREKMRNNNTKALVAAVYSHPVRVVAHPGLQMAVEMDELGRACAARSCALEINTGHEYDKDEVVLAALRHGAPLVVNSDAHFPASVGDLDSGARLIEKYGVPVEQVLNARKQEWV